MKKTIIPLCLLLSACSNIDLREPVTTGIDVSTNITMTDITRATVASAASRLTYVLINEADEIVQSGHKTSDMESLSLDCPVGTYTLILAANSGTEPTINDGGTLTYTKVGDGFSDYKTLTIASNERKALTSTLSRFVSCLHFLSHDNVDATATKCKVTVGGISHTYDASTALGTDNYTHDTGIINTSAITKSGKLEGSVYCILPSASISNATLTITLYNASGETLNTLTYDNLPMQKNKQTNLTAAMFHEHGTDAAVSITSTTWDEPINVER